MTQALNLANLANYINSSGKLDASQALTGTVTSTGLNISNDASISGLTVGKGGGGSSLNTVVGYQAASTATGTALTAIGYQAGYANTENTFGTTFVGYQAGYGNTTGVNTAVGSLALKTNTTGSNNVAIGGQSMQANTTGSSNSALGNNSLVANTTGSYNTATGQAALASNTTASNNTAVGYQSLYSNTTGTYNTVLGYQSGYSNTTGTVMVAIGYQAAYNATTSVDVVAIGGYRTGYNITSGSQIVAVGREAAQGMTSGSAAVAVGYQSLYNATTAIGNTAIGNQAGYGSTGQYNTYLGWSSGYDMTTGSKNTIVGRYGGNQDGLDIRTSSNYVVLSDGDGNRAAYWQSGGGWVQKNNSTSWSTYSDQRIKENIKDIAGLEIITALHPVEFDYKVADKKHDIGFIAQEYQTVLPDQVMQENAVSEEIKELTNGGALLTIQQNLVPYLVKAVQELKAEVDSLKQQLGK